MGETLRILHLEDDSADAELIEAILTADGLICETVRVSTKRQFLAALDGPYDLILSDYSMPGFDGVTAQAIARTRRPDLPFVFVSGTIGEEVAIERLKEGATDYVFKQRLARLPSAVRRALDERQERRERLRAENEVRRLNRELEARVVERTAQLGAANAALAAREAELERANRAKSEFLSRMSHDLRTPLNAILGFAQILETELHAPEQADSVRQILNGGTHLLDLINEVLDIAAIEAGRLPLSPETLALGASVAEVVDLLRPLADARRITIASTIDAAVSVRGDRQRVRQILVNLAGNAVKYNRDGGSVHVSSSQSGDRVRVSVADTGAGIAPAQMTLLFRPFERLGAESGPVEGTGLGLAVSKGLIEAMEGALGVDSTVGTGTTFWFELPAASQDAAHDADARAARGAETESRPSSGTILYIEDNASNIRLLQRLLTRRPGVSLIAARTGAEGLAAAARELPDAIVLDLHLPDMHGEDVLAGLRANPSTAAIPVAVLSADSVPAQAERARAAGAVGFMAKPVDIRKLLAFIDRPGHPDEAPPA